MKKNIIQAFTLMLLVSIIACKPEPVYVLEPFGNSAEGLNGAWKLLKVTQTDEIVKLAVKPELDITQFLTGGGEVTMKFDKTNMSYQNTGSAKVNYLGNNGTFRFDNPSTPSQLILTEPNGQVYTLIMSAPIRPEYPNNNLILKYTRILRGKKAVSYNYIFKRQ